MKTHHGFTRSLALVAMSTAVLLAGIVYGQSSREIPKTWDDAAIESLELPLAVSDVLSRACSFGLLLLHPDPADLQELSGLWPGKEPAGYLDWLKQQEPAIAFDASRLQTVEDWTRAGEMVFDAPIVYDTDGLGVVTRPVISVIRPGTGKPEPLWPAMAPCRSSATSSARKESSKSASFPAGCVIRG